MGRALPNDASRDDIRAAVTAVLGDPSYQANARCAGAELKGIDGPSLAADSIEDVLARKAAVPA